MRIDLERNLEAPSLARAAVRGRFQDTEIDPSSLATLTLLVSELVTNAVVHSDAAPASKLALCVHSLRADALRVQVTDQGSGFIPVLRDPGRAGGYGLYLIDKQADRWGIDRIGGSRVWFEVPSPGHDRSRVGGS